jgi:hypothetical protein
MTPRLRTGAHHGLYRPYLYTASILAQSHFAILPVH